MNANVTDIKFLQQDNAFLHMGESKSKKLTNSNKLTFRLAKSEDK